MATLILSTAGAAAGTALGGPIGAVVGRVVGAAAGAGIDGALLGGGRHTRFLQGPRLADVAGLTSTEGDPIPRVYGRAKLGGVVIWATRPLEVANTAVERAGAAAKGAGGQRTVRTTYAYVANLAVGVCEGEIAFVRRIWADGKEIDQTQVTLRVHTGGPDQAPDPLIVAKEGASNAPAYRGLAYVVFEGLPLAEFGNRVPQFAFEAIRPVNGLFGLVRAVDLIPGAGEFALDPDLVTVDLGFGRTRAANRNQLQRATDVTASLDALQALCPNLRRVAVVATWFGTDLRAGACRVVPKVEFHGKTTLGDVWRVAGIDRAAAEVVSTLPDGSPAFGGTPSDAGLGRLVADLAARGLEVVLYPFVMMDVPAGSGLPDPRVPGAAQPQYPWRGRITCDPAPDVPGSPDGTAAADAQVAGFFAGGYAAMVLHYADLAAGWAAAGAPLAGFVIGSEFVGLTRVRGAAGYPAVAAFRALAAGVRGRLGSGVKLVYGADWTEYGAHVRDGGATVRFPLDDLFMDAAIDAVGIDWYPPVTDWRDTPGHADLAASGDIYDRAFLKRRGAAGEAFDWYYADAAGRAAQARLPITDGAHAKPWTFRAKDLVGWWANRHVERDGGVETRATAWVPGGKPVWLTEIGVPAVDKGTNGPNVFPDPKSSEGAYPPESRRLRDELIQLRGLEAVIARFDPATPGFSEADNPVSPVYGGRMVDPGAVFVWSWDARPFPAFPDVRGVWDDIDNWRVGHWVTGRIEGCDLDLLVGKILAEFGVDAGLSVEAAAYLDGYVVDRPLSARAALETLVQVYGLDVSAVGGALRLRGPRRDAPVVLAEADLVRVSEDGEVLRRVRTEESALPRSVEIGVTDSESPDYRRAAAAAIRPAGARRRETRIEAAIVTRRETGDALAEALLDRTIAARDGAVLTLSPRRMELEPGDLLAIPADVPGGAVLRRIDRIDDAPTGRRIEASGVPPRPGGARGLARTRAAPAAPVPAFPGPPFALPLDLPVDRGSPTILQVLAVAADPWPGQVAVWRAEGAGPLALRGFVDYPACLGRTLSDLPPGPLWRRDPAARLDVSLRHAGALASVGTAAMLGGANTFAVVAPDGTVEILSAEAAVLTGPETYRLAGLLRGLAGSEASAGRTAPAGSRIVRLDGGAVIPLVDRLDETGRGFRYRVGPASRDPGDPSYAEFAATAGLGALRPLRPVHLRARREAGGVRVTWIRRARRDADAWEPVEIPGDGPEAYAVTLFSAATPVRRLTAAAQGLLYAAADEAADFGGPQAVLDVAVAQVGPVAGPGPACRARVPVRSA
ncbi:glycoside hydrolase/phage tail family protein [Methylobacterium sp. NEAU 140]|uniref:baseplate multidomain protein megatron n=1 Tax=Methylobacterium sp. NEAU 140 TaxID=3064945 RepID=UPI002736A544|nr:glycoside hydrolase/phage tail family protein [Methylobacterium sp. NEAU 140]MDP4021404.1 glycoside hydrolase/phage tail family protein [Methylobacterium sp. NEAU 140]